MGSRRQYGDVQSPSIKRRMLRIKADAVEWRMAKHLDNGRVWGLNECTQQILALSKPRTKRFASGQLGHDHNLWLASRAPSAMVASFA